MVVAIAIYGLTFVIIGMWMTRAQTRYLDRVRSPTESAGDQSIAGFVSRLMTDPGLLDSEQEDPELEALRQRAAVAFRLGAIWALGGGFVALTFGGWIDQTFGTLEFGSPTLLWALFAVGGLASAALGIWRLRRPEIQGLDRLISVVAVIVGLGFALMCAALAVAA